MSQIGQNEGSQEVDTSPFSLEVPLSPSEQLLLCIVLTDLRAQRRGRLNEDKWL